MRKNYYFNAKNKHGIRIQVSYIIYVRLFECYFLSDFIVLELTSSCEEEVTLNCSNDFLRLLVNSYFEVNPILKPSDFGFSSYDNE